MQVEWNEVKKVGVKRYDLNSAILAPSEIRVVGEDEDIVPIGTVDILTDIL